MSDGRSELVQLLYELLRDLKIGDCWCECGIDNPNYCGKHTERCLKAQVTFAAVKKELNL